MYTLFISILLLLSYHKSINYALYSVCIYRISYRNWFFRTCSKICLCSGDLKKRVYLTPKNFYFSLNLFLQDSYSFSEWWKEDKIHFGDETDTNWRQRNLYSFCVQFPWEGFPNISVCCWRYVNYFVCLLSLFLPILPQTFQRFLLAFIGFFVISKDSIEKCQKMEPHTLYCGF